MRGRDPGADHRASPHEPGSAGQVIDDNSPARAIGRTGLNSSGDTVSSGIPCLGPLKHLPAIPVRLAPGARFNLHPAWISSRAIGLIGKLRDDPFVTSAGSGGEELMRIFKFLRVAQLLVVALGEQMAQVDSAFEQRAWIVGPCR